MQPFFIFGGTHLLTPPFITGTKTGMDLSGIDDLLFYSLAC
jgi:hypothetical protein